jgi:hypothetical protein
MEDPRNKGNAVFDDRTTTEFWNVRCLRARCSWFLGIGICCAYVSKNPYPSYRRGNSWKRVSVARADRSLNTSADTITFVSVTMRIYFRIALSPPRTSCTSRSTSSSRMPCRSARARPYSLTSSHQDRALVVAQCPPDQLAHSAALPFRNRLSPLQHIRRQSHRECLCASHLHII